MLVAVLASIIAALGSSAQSLHVDWSKVTIDEMSGQASFGPRLDVAEDMLNASSMLGFFANSDGFYGRPAWTEYLLLQRAADDRLEAVKIVGDRNVPRGQRTWRTAPGYFGEPTARAYIQLHLRDDPSDPDGYMWSPGDHEIAWDAGQLYDSDSCEEGLLCRFIIIGPNPTGEFESVFYRVNEATALEAARQFTDAQ